MKNNFLGLTIVVIAITMISGCGSGLTSEQKDKIKNTIKQQDEQFTKAVFEKATIIKSESKGNVTNARCYNENRACSYMVILDFAKKTDNFEDEMIKYTEEFALAKENITQSKLGIMFSLLGKVGNYGLLCKIDRELSPNYHTTCSEVDVGQYDK